jgi:hypothetical protein
MASYSTQEHAMFLTLRTYASGFSSKYTTTCHGSDFALTPPPVNSGHVQHLAPICRTSSIFQHHSDPIPATPVAKIAASPSLRTRLPLLPSHPLVSFTVPLSSFPLRIPFTIHPSLCHMFKTPISLSYHHRPSRPYRTSCFTIASDFHEYLFLYYASHRILYCI